MFANLKKKLEEGGVVSPVGAERKAGNSSVTANSTSRIQSSSYVHGEGVFQSLLHVIKLLYIVCVWN